MGQYNYKCKSWQGFIQQAITLISKGYHYYFIVSPKKSLDEDSWQRIDARIITKFDLERSNKDNRYYNKKRGLANYHYLRYGNISIVLRTEGSISDNVKDEKFLDIYAEALVITLSLETSFKISKKVNEKRVTLYLENDTYRSIKAELFTLLEKNRVNDLKNTFALINDFPAYAGINKQKRQLIAELIDKSKKCNNRLKWTDFTLNLRRKIYKVF